MTDDANQAAPRGFSTRAIRAATRAPRVDQRPNSVPIYQSATFSADNAEELGAIASGTAPGYAYARLANPTGDALAAAIAELEGAEAAGVFASGMAAIHAALLSVLRAGDRVVATKAIYGSTRTLLSNRFGTLGVEIAYVDASDLAAVEAALAAAPTRVLYAETLSNPTIVVADIAALAGLAHRHGALLVVDNTFASPVICRPIELGADLAIESLTKYLGGHSDLLGGVGRGLARADRRGQVRGGRHRGDARAVRGLPRPARDRHPRDPDGPSRGVGEGPGRRGSSASPGSSGSTTRTYPATRSERSRHASSRTAAACSRSSWKADRPAAGRRAARSSTRSRSRSGPRRWGASTRSSLTRPRPPIASSMPRPWPRPASRRDSCAARSGSRTSTTWSRTSDRRSRRLGGPPPRRPARGTARPPRPTGCGRDRRDLGDRPIATPVTTGPSPPGRPRPTPSSGSAGPSGGLLHLGRLRRRPDRRPRGHEPGRDDDPPAAVVRLPLAG